MMELIWISTAYLTGLISSRLSFPPLVGYLVAGYVLHGLDYSLCYLCWLACVPEQHLFHPWR